MKQLMIIGLIVVLTAFLGIGLTKDPGYILIIFHHWQVETSLILAGFLLMAFVLGMMLLVKGLHQCLDIPFTLYKKFRSWRQYRAEQGLNKGLQAFYQGQWKLALKKLRPENIKTTWTTDLIAAEAAQKDGALQQRDQFIHHALDIQPSAQESILLFQAKLQIEQQQFEQAQATLKKIGQEFPQPTYQWLKLQLDIHAHFQEYEAGLRLLECQSKLFKNETEYLKLFRMFLIPVLKQAIENQNDETALNSFKIAPKVLQNEPDILEMMVPHFIDQRFIRQLIEKQLTAETNSDILAVIAKIPPSTDWLKKLEKVREQQPDNAMLYFVFGKIEAGLKLWGSAIKDLQKSISLQPSYQAYTLLAQVYMDLDQQSNALAAMQKALQCQH